MVPANPEIAAIDLTDPVTFIEYDPRALWRRIRAEWPVYWHPGRAGYEGFWVLTRYADVLAVYKDAGRFASGRGTVLDVLLRGDDSAGGKMLAVTDGERHRQIRKVMLRALSPRLLGSVVEKARARARQLVADVIDVGCFDFASQVAEHIPMKTICDLLSIPEEDREQLLQWNKMALSSDDAPVDELDALAARNEIVLYLSGLARDRRSHPGEDLISMIATATVVGQSLTIDEIALNCYSLIIGGDESSRMSAIIAVLALAQNPEQFAALRNRNVSLDTATEEMLRWATPAMHFARRATEDVEVGGHRIRTGDIVTLWNTSANDDETEFTKPQRLDLARKPNKHLSFGYGPHFCLGAFLGRAELRAVLESVVDSVSEIELAGPAQRLYSNFLFGYSNLPVRFGA